MHIEIFVHADRSGARASVGAWWADGGGIHHAYLLEREPLRTQGPEASPWELLRALWPVLAARYSEHVAAQQLTGGDVDQDLL